MRVHENIRFMRLYKNWTQETMANKLGISTLAYAKIERGETDINLSRLQQIAEVMEIDLTQLFGLNDKNVLNFTSEHGIQNIQFQEKNHNYCQVNYSSSTEQEMEYLKKENELLQQQNSEYKDIIHILKNN
jgi:transcriptional regulator with XRE-family HTH domain